MDSNFIHPPISRVSPTCILIPLGSLMLAHMYNYHCYFLMVGLIQIGAVGLNKALSNLWGVQISQTMGCRSFFHVSNLSKQIGYMSKVYRKRGVWCLTVLNDCSDIIGMSSACLNLVGNARRSHITSE